MERPDLSGVAPEVLAYIAALEAQLEAHRAPSEGGEPQRSTLRAKRAAHHRST
jgi:hypothetical protein